MTKISIIIPVLNESAIIEQTLSQFDNNYDIEIIIVDGGSQDSTIELVKKYSQNSDLITLLHSPSGRANQMNMGAKTATGDILLFLHADTLLPKNYQQLVLDILLQPQVILGAFELGIDSQEIAIRFLEFTIEIRSRLFGLPYGDQGLFITKKNFDRLGGYSNIPIMEDFEFVQRIKHYGKIFISSAKVITSSRRWQKLVILKTTIINQLVIIGYYLGISPLKLSKFYRGINYHRKLEN